MATIDRRVSVACMAAVGALAATAPVQVVVATEYLSVEAAQKALFAQADRFKEVVLSLDTFDMNDTKFTPANSFNLLTLLSSLTPPMGRSADW